VPLSYPLAQWIAGESHPDLRLAGTASSSWTSSPVGPWSAERGAQSACEEPSFVVGAPRFTLRASRQLRRPDSNRRRTAYETVLEPGSSPLRKKYSRQDSNLRSAPCEGAAVAAGPRE